MSAPRFTWSHLVGWPLTQAQILGARGRWSGQVIEVPATFQEEEHAAVVDALLALTRWPVEAVRSGEVLRRPVIALFEGEGPTPAVSEGVVVRSSLIPDGAQELLLSPTLRRLAQELFDLLGQRAGAGPLARVAGLGPLVADSPATAAWFVSGAWRAVERASEVGVEGQELLAAGLADVIVGMLSGAGEDLAQWTLALAIDPALPSLLVSDRLAAVPREDAMGAAFGRGLALWRPKQARGAPPVLRRPLHAVGELRSSDGSAGWARLLSLLAGRLSDEALGPLRRGVDVPPPLGLPVPSPPSPLIGREEERARLIDLLMPGDRQTVVVLSGPIGSGKRALAASVADALRRDREPVWVELTSRPLEGLRALAKALKLDWPSGPAPEDPEQVAERLGALHHALRGRSALLVFAGAERVSEAELSVLIPRGPGRVAILVLSERDERALVEARGASSLVLEPLGLESARQILLARAPEIREPVEAGEADGLINLLGGHAGALAMAGDALRSLSIAEVSEQIAASSGGPVQALAGGLLRSVSPEARRAAAAVAVGPETGGWLNVVQAVAEIADAEPIQELARRGLAAIDGERARPLGLLRLAARQTLGVEALEEAERRHCVGVCEAWLRAIQEGQSSVYQLGADFDVAVSRLRKLVDGGDSELPMLAAKVAESLIGVGSSHREPLMTALELVESAWRLRRERGTSQELLTMDYVRASALVALVGVGDLSRVEEAVAACREVCYGNIDSFSPGVRAMMSYHLGLALMARRAGNQEENLREAREALERARSLAEAEGIRPLLTGAIMNLGNLSMQAGPNDRKHLERAKDHYLQALGTSDPGEDLAGWASLQSNLGLALLRLASTSGVRPLDALGPTAIGAALTGADLNPRGWAIQRHNLADLLRKVSSDRSGLAAQVALRIDLEIAGQPADRIGLDQWATARIGVAQSALQLSSGRPELVEFAITQCREVIDRVPVQEYAAQSGPAHLQLGVAYRLLGARGHGAALSEAERALRAARDVALTSSRSLSVADASLHLALTLFAQPGPLRGSRLREALQLCDEALQLLPADAPNAAEAAKLRTQILSELSSAPSSAPPG